MPTRTKDSLGEEHNSGRLADNKIRENWIVDTGKRRIEVTVIGFVYEIGTGIKLRG